MNQLMVRYLKPLRQWARGRLPGYARDLYATDDLVQEVALSTLQRLSKFEPARQGALPAYLRTAVTNRIRDEIRRAAHRPDRVEIENELPAESPSPFDLTATNEAQARYERGLLQLRNDERELIAASVEFGYSYEEIAEMQGRPSANAVRVAVRRALLRLAKVMRREPDAHA
jgi:RNA polymerase sigma-70 factor (ECF subfamily)